MDRNIQLQLYEEEYVLATSNNIFPITLLSKWVISPI